MNKECIITNGTFSWVMNVDGKVINFQGHDNAEYFKDLYTNMGYEVKFETEPIEA